MFLTIVLFLINRMRLSQIYSLVLAHKQHEGTCQIWSDQWQLVSPPAQSGLHRDVIGHLPLPVRLLYGDGCVDHLSSVLHNHHGLGIKLFWDSICCSFFLTDLSRKPTAMRWHFCPKAEICVMFKYYDYYIYNG